MLCEVYLAPFPILHQCCLDKGTANLLVSVCSAFPAIETVPLNRVIPMRRMLLLATTCLWIISLVGCGGGDDSSDVASNNPTPPVDEQYPGGTGGASAPAAMESEGGYPSGPEGGGMEEGYGEEMEEGMEEGYGEEMEEGMEEGYDEEMEEGMEEGYEEEMGEEYADEMEEGYEEYDEEMMEEGYGDEMEDGYEEGYEEGMEEGYGRGRPGGEGGYGRGTREPAKPLTLQEMAQAAFQQGKDREAFQFLYGHALTADDQAATELLSKMGLLTPAKRPALAVRWGVGVALTGPQGTNPYPIGTKQNQVGAPRGGQRGGLRAGGGGDSEGGFAPEGAMGVPQVGLVEGPRPFDAGDAPAGAGPVSGGPIDPVLKQMTGELGQKMVDGLRQRIAQGDFGQVLVVTGAAPSRSRGGYGGGMESGYGGDMESGYGDEEESGYGGGYSQPMGRGRGGNQQKGPSQLAPGAVMLGVGNIKDLKTVAGKYEVDVLCVFNVALKPNLKIGTTINETTIAIYNMADGKETYESKKLNNIAVQVARQGGKPDNVDKEIEDLFEHIDSTWKLGPMPALTEEGVLARLRPVITEPQENPLPILAEIRMYKTRSLLNDQFFAIAYKSVLGDQQAAILATGTEDQKKEAISQWLPKQ